MARTFLSQPTQIFNTEGYNDALTPGSSLQTTSVSIESDLNALRTQIRQLLWAGVSGSWYDPITAPSGSNSARGLNTINLDLTDLEQKRFLFRRQSLNLLNVATGSNFAFLSVSLGTAPANYAAVSHPLLPASISTGSLVALLSGTEGTYGSHSVAQTSGSSVLTPKNLVSIRDAFTGQQVTASNGRYIFGLMQSENGTLSGDAFNDSTRRTQISFVFETVLNGTSSITAAPAASVGGRTFEYIYGRRTALDDIPEDAYLSNTIFVDAAGSTGGGSTSVTLDNVIDNQIGTVTQDQNIAIRIGAGFSWTFLSASKELWKLVSSDTTDTMTVAVDRISVSSSFATAYQLGISVSTGSNQLDLGVNPGTINSQVGNNLILSGGNQLRFSDNYGPGSTYTGGTIPFATASLEWNQFATDFGTATSLLGAIHVLSQSISGSRRWLPTRGGITANPLSPDTNVTFPTNIDAQLGSYLGKDFTKDLSIFLNGVLLLPGTSANPNDVYPGTSPSTGDLKFPYKLRSGSVVTMVIH
jgi:hypothetical protein